MPSKQGRQLTGQLRSLASLSQPPPPSFHPSSRLCMLLNDLREARSQQAELSGAVRTRLPGGWWGSAGPAESGRGADSLRLGDRFKLCQVHNSSVSQDTEQSADEAAGQDVVSSAIGMRVHGLTPVFGRDRWRLSGDTRQRCTMQSSGRRKAWRLCCL